MHGTTLPNAKARWRLARSRLGRCRRLVVWRNA
jgi:hypothetical protein